MAKTNTPKSFTGSAKGKVKSDPISFDVGDQTVEAKPTVDGWTTLKFLQGLSSDSSSEVFSAVQMYLEASFDANNRRKFISVVEDVEQGFELDDIVKIMQWLVEERADGRDFEESSE